MRAKAVVTILLAALMLASCEAWVRPEKSGAEFRSLARNMYSSLEQPSCESLTGFNRRDYLNGELNAVVNFEAEARATPAWGHLVVAREDARYEIIRHKGCWSDPSRSWAQLHIDMTKDEVETTLPQLRALVPSLRKLSIDDRGDPSKSAEFRYFVRRMLTGITHPCRLTNSTSVSDEEVLRPASDAVSRLKEELADTRFLSHWAIAEADAAYRESITLVKCAPPLTVDPKQVSLEIAAQTEQQIAEIRKIVKGP